MVECESCGKRISSLGGSFEVDGKIICSKCEKLLWKKRVDNLERDVAIKRREVIKQSDENVKLLTLIETMDKLLKEQRYANQYLNKITNILMFFLIVFLIGLLLMLAGLGTI